MWRYYKGAYSLVHVNLLSFTCNPLVTSLPYNSNPSITSPLIQHDNIPYIFSSMKLQFLHHIASPIPLCVKLHSIFNLLHAINHIVPHPLHAFIHLPSPIPSMLSMTSPLQSPLCARSHSVWSPTCIQLHPLSNLLHAINDISFPIPSMWSFTCLFDPSMPLQSIGYISSTDGTVVKN